MAKARIEPIQMMDVQLDIIDIVRDEVIERFHRYLIMMGQEFENILEFIKNPIDFKGTKEGVRQIVQYFLEIVIGNHYSEIKNVNLTIKYVNSTIMNKLFGAK